MRVANRSLLQDRCYQGQSTRDNETLRRNIARHSLFIEDNHFLKVRVPTIQLSYFGLDTLKHVFLHRHSSWKFTIIQNIRFRIYFFVGAILKAVDAPLLHSWNVAPNMTASPIPQIDLANWMTNLPERVKNRPLIRVSIPGSHNSGACDLSSKAGSDAFCINIPLISRPWATCQRLPVKYQLNHGIRYLDFRLDFDPNEEKLYITHFLRAKTSPMKCLESVNEFLTEHPAEIVIIDFQHFYRFNEIIKNKFLCDVLDLFGSKVCTVPETNALLTIAYLQDRKYQVILIHRHNGRSACSDNLNAFFFSPNHFPTFWPDTDNATRVIETAQMAHRAQKGFGYITQLVLTLQGATNFVYLDLKNFYKSRMHDKMMSWLNNISGISLPNIVISDFIEINNFCFPLTVIKLNYLQGHETLAQIENKLRVKEP